DRVEDFDIEQAIKLLAEELLSLVYRGLYDRVFVFVERNVRPVRLEEILVYVKSNPERLQGRFEPLYRILLRRLVETLVVNTTNSQDYSEIPAFCQERLLIPEAVQIYLGVQRSRFLPRLNDMI